MSPVNFAALRTRFPLLAERTYFDTPSLGPVPEATYGDLAEYIRTIGLRSRAIPLYFERINELVGLYEQLLHAERGSVALQASATAAQAAIAAAVEPRPDKNRILYGALDFHSARYLWVAQAHRGFSVQEVEASNGVGVRPEDVLRHLDERVAIVALSLVSPHTGALVDIAPVVKAAHDAGALVLLDVYQAVGIVPIDVQALGVDAVIGGAHKWLYGGGMGLAFLYVRPALAERLTPAYPGWIGHARITGFCQDFEPASGAARFQQGTPAMEPIYSARAGLRLVLEVGVEQLRARSVALTQRMMARATQAGLPITTPLEPSRRGGMLCLRVAEPDAIVARLSELGIDIGSRPNAGIRIAPHPCNTEEECDRVIDEVSRLVRR